MNILQDIFYILPLGISQECNLWYICNFLNVIPTNDIPTELCSRYLPLNTYDNDNIINNYTHSILDSGFHIYFPYLYTWNEGSRCQTMCESC